MKRKVVLKLFEDDANGQWGLAHSNAISAGFNAFWDGIGIFHDVFEHWFEDNHKHFRGDAAFNQAGEMVAMGVMCYLVDEIGVWQRRMDTNYWSINNVQRIAVHGEIDSVIDHLCGGGYNFGHEMVTHFRHQKRVVDAELEHHINEEYKRLVKYVGDPENRDEYFSEEMFKSFSLQRIRDCYRYGYRLAHKHYAKCDCRNSMNEFIEIFTNFCKTHTAREISQDYTFLIVTVETGKRFNWHAKFIPDPGPVDVEPIILKPKKHVVSY